jgi:plasmid stabilization system protein ParE
VFPEGDAGHLRPGLRKASAGAYVLYFRRGEDGAAEIIRILHRRMDVQRRMG